MFKLKFPSVRNSDQSGINIVDLMMWLVVASLMSSTSLQSTGYYRVAAQSNNLKSDAQNVRAYMEGQYAQTGDYPNGAELQSAVDAGDVDLSPNNRVTGVYQVDGLNDWAVRICSLDTKAITNNAPGTAVRFTKNDPNKYDFRVCSALDEPQTTF